MKIRIAIADDNKFLISTIKEKLSFFEDLTYEFSAENGEELLNKLRNNSAIDLILMDIEMPVMNGIEATFETFS
jgi:CheY-like chemotaxis protein